MVRGFIYLGRPWPAMLAGRCLPFSPSVLVRAILFVAHGVGSSSDPAFCQLFVLVDFHRLFFARSRFRAFRTTWNQRGITVAVYVERV